MFVSHREHRKSDETPYNDKNTHFKAVVPYLFGF